MDARSLDVTDAYHRSYVQMPLNTPHFKLYDARWWRLHRATVIPATQIHNVLNNMKSTSTCYGYGTTPQDHRHRSWTTTTKIQSAVTLHHAGVMWLGRGGMSSFSREFTWSVISTYINVNIAKVRGVSGACFIRLYLYVDLYIRACVRISCVRIST